MPMSQNVLELKGIKKAFGSREILKGVDISIQKGETMVIVGGSGTGKSVSIRHAIGLLEPDEGDVFIFGERMNGAHKKTKARLRSRANSADSPGSVALIGALGRSNASQLRRTSCSLS